MHLEQPERLSARQLVSEECRHRAGASIERIVAAQYEVLITELLGERDGNDAAVEFGRGIDTDRRRRTDGDRISQHVVGARWSEADDGHLAVPTLGDRERDLQRRFVGG